MNNLINLPAISAVKVGRTDQIEFGIDPVYPVEDEVQGDAVGPSHRLGDDSGPMGPIHSGSLDLRTLTPIRPEHPSTINKMMLSRDYLLSLHAYIDTTVTFIFVLFFGQMEK